VPPALLVLIQAPPDALIFWLILLIFLLGAWQHVVLNLIAPKVYGHHLGIDPIVLFAAMLLEAKVGGVWGAFFAAPMVAIGYAILETFYDRFTSTHPAFLVQERLEEERARYEPFEQTAREVRPHLTPVRTHETTRSSVVTVRNEHTERPEQSSNGADVMNGLRPMIDHQMPAPQDTVSNAHSQYAGDGADHAAVRESA
jgi:hypothetical protein